MSVFYGLDTSNHQSRDGFDVERARTEGFEFLTHKMTEGTWMDPCFAAVATQAQAHFAGRWGGYVFCRVATTPQDEADAVVAAAALAGLSPGDFPLQIDYEDTETDGSGVDLLARARAHQARGWDLLPVYLPRWYWSGHMGSPDLSGLPVGLWDSNYVSGPGYASTLYPGDDSPGWAPFAGRPVTILQFTEQAIAAGENPIDANAFRGTATELDAVFASKTGAPEMPDSTATAILEQETGPGSTPDQATGWPATRYHLDADHQPHLTQTDYLRAIDTKVNSELPAEGDAPNPRPKPVSTPDDLFGHVLSLRAQLGQTQAMLVALAQHVGGQELADELTAAQGVLR